MDILFSLYFVGYLLALFTIFIKNKNTYSESEKFELNLALVVSLLGYILILMIVLDYLDKKFQDRLKVCSFEAKNLYAFLNKKFMGN